jgi:hypothetical protein
LSVGSNIPLAELAESPDMIPVGGLFVAVADADRRTGRLKRTMRAH